MRVCHLLLLGLLLCGPASLRSAPPAEQGPAGPTANREVSGDPVIKGPANLPDLPIKRLVGSIRTLVTTHTATGAVGTMQLVRLSATAQPGPAGAPADLGYDRFLGPLTLKSLDQISQAVAALHKGWPRGQQLRLTFSDTPAPVELGASTLAATLLLDSLLRDWEIEPNLAVLGSILPDGSIEPVGAISDRLYGAARARVGRIVVPAKNEVQVADFLLSQGIAAFVGTQIFTAANFNDAGPLVAAPLAPETKEMMDLFGAVQRTLVAAGGNAVPLLRNERVQGTLQQVLTKAPNHLSAKVLYDWGTGKRAVMSANGSAEYLERGAADLIKAMRAPSAAAALQIDKPALTDNLARLRFTRERLDPVVRPYAEALFKFGESVQKALGNSSRPPTKLASSLQKELEAAQTQAKDAWSKMASARAGLTP